MSRVDCHHRPSGFSAGVSFQRQARSSTHSRPKIRRTFARNRVGTTSLGMENLAFSAASRGFRTPARALLRTTTYPLSVLLRSYRYAMFLLTPFPYFASSSSLSFPLLPLYFSLLFSWYRSSLSDFFNPSWLRDRFFVCRTFGIFGLRSL